MKTFWLTANLEGASLRIMVKSKSIDDLVSNWSEGAAKVTEQIKNADMRGATKDFVIQALKEGSHHTDPEVGQMVAQALLWLSVNGPLGEGILPYMREGGPNMALHHEITHLGGSTYNFRTTVDEKTTAAMQSSDLV
jgi:hypothetical protein